MQSTSAHRVAGWHVAVVATAALLPYFSSPSNPLIYDAKANIVYNDTLREGPLGRLFTVDYWGRVPDWLSHRSWRPLVSLTFALQARNGGDSPAVYHLVDMILHASVALLVLALFLRLGILPEWALSGSLLFALHPIQTDAVCSVAARADILAAGCLFAALVLHLGGPDGPGAWLRQGGVVLLLAAALLCKEYAVAFPFLVMAVDLARRGGAETAEARRRQRAVWAGALVALAGYLLVRHALFGAFGAIPEGPNSNPIAGHAVDVRSFTALSILLTALRLLALPYGLNHHYRFGTLPIVESLGNPRALAGLALVLALVALALYARVRRREAIPLIAVSLILLPLLPTLGIVSIGGVLFAERFLYVPVAGLALGSVWALERWCGVGARRRGVLWGFAALLLLLGLATARRVEAWSSMEQLVRASLRVYPDSWENRRMLGEALLVEQGPSVEALEAFDRALEKNPKDARAWKGRADVTSVLGRHAEAAEAWRHVVELVPPEFPLPVLLRTLADARLRAGDVEGAIESLARAREIAPDDAATVEALARLQQLDPELLRRKHDLAQALIEQGRFPEAVQELQEILLVRPDHAPSLFNLARAFDGAGRKEDAIQALRRGLALQEDDRARRYLEELLRR